MVYTVSIFEKWFTAGFFKIKEQQIFFCEGPYSVYLIFAGLMISVKILNLIIMAWKQPLTINQWIGMAIFQYNFIYKNRQLKFLSPALNGDTS